MFSWILKKNKDNRDHREPEAEDPGDRLEENIAAIARQDKGGELQEVVTEVEESIKEASKTSLRDLRFQAAGRCPDCGKAVESFIQTQVCTNCGWSSYMVPADQKTVVHISDGSQVRCDRAFVVRGGDVLCLTADVVTQYIPRRSISFIEYQWTDEDRERRRLDSEREKHYLCAWCQKEVDSDKMIVVYAAFGTFQNRFIFCCDKCKEAFHKQYPSRIHRNCYDADCEECELCVKRYDNANEELRVHSHFVRAVEANGKTGPQ